MSNTKVCSQCGGGYGFDHGDMIAGNSAVVSYNDCAPPVIIDHKISASRCNQTGGKKGGSRKMNSKKSKMSKKSKKSKMSKMSKKSKSSKKSSTRKTLKKSSKKQKGGNPGKYPFDGKNSEYSADMSKRTFGCRQPDWEPTCV